MLLMMTITKMPMSIASRVWALSTCCHEVTSMPWSSRNDHGGVNLQNLYFASPKPPGFRHRAREFLLVGPAHLLFPHPEPWFYTSKAFQTAQNLFLFTFQRPSWASRTRILRVQSIQASGIEQKKQLPWNSEMLNSGYTTLVETTREKHGTRNEFSWIPKLFSSNSDHLAHTSMECCAARDVLDLDKGVTGLWLILNYPSFVRAKLWWHVVLRIKLSASLQATIGDLDFAEM